MIRLVGAACGLAAVALAAVACGPSRKAQLIYEEPVTTVWSGRGEAPAQPAALPDATMPAPAAPSTAPAFPQAEPTAPSHAPAAYAPTQAYPPSQQAPPQASPPAWGAQQNAPQAYPNAQAVQQPPPGAWRNTPPSARQQHPTGFPDESVTTTVVPDNDPTTQTTLKRRTGWVRGGYD